MHTASDRFQKVLNYQLITNDNFGAKNITNNDCIIAIYHLNAFVKLSLSEKNSFKNT